MVHQNKSVKESSSTPIAADWGHYQQSKKAMIIDDDDQEDYIQANGQMHVAQEEDIEMIDTTSIIQEMNGIAMPFQENDVTINEEGIGIEGWEDPDYFESAEEQREIQRLKELRQQKRKLQASDYIPFDETTSGGLVAHEQSRISQNTSINSIEAQMIQRKLIKDHYAGPPKVQPRMTLKKGIFDMDQQQHHHFEIGEGQDEEEDEEVEALIQKRVKEGAGLNYEQIVKRDIVNYKKVQSTSASGFDEIQKFENSKSYKQIQAMMEFDEDSLLQDIDISIEKVKECLTSDQSNAAEMRKQMETSQQLINDADHKFQSNGEQFIKVKEALETVEDLKEMLTEKQPIIIDLVNRQLEVEKEIAQSIDATLISHVADIYKECQDPQMPYGLSKNFSDIIDRMVTDTRLQGKRKIFRQVNQQLEDQGMLWQSITDHCRTMEFRGVEVLREEAAQTIFSDVSDEYQSLKKSLFKALEKLSTIPDTKFELSDISEMILPYLQNEVLCSGESGVFSIFDIDQSSVMKEVKEFIDSQPCYAETQKESFTASLISQAIQPHILSFIANLWNPFDLQETQSLCSILDAYLQRIYVGSSLKGQTEEGMENVKSILKAVIKRYNRMIEIFHLTSKTCIHRALVNAINSLGNSMIIFKDILPPTNIDDILIEAMLQNNFLKALGKRLHALLVNSQIKETEGIEEKEIIQSSFDQILGERALLNNYLIERLNDKSSPCEYKERVINLLRELQSKGLEIGVSLSELLHQQ